VWFGCVEHTEREIEEDVEEIPPSAEIVQEDTASSAPELREESDDPLTSMEATILGLEWEVTQEGLEKFHAEATELQEHLSDNREAQILVQGLQALGSYIREEKSNAHPDAFTILHAFYDALKLLIKDTNLTPEQRKRVLVEQIDSLNSLKAVIAQSAAERAAEERGAEKAEFSETKETAESEHSGGEGELEQDVASDDDTEFDSPVADDELELFSEEPDESADFSFGEEDADELFLDGDDSLSGGELEGEEDIAGDFDFDGEGGLDEDLFADEAESSEQELTFDDDAIDEDDTVFSPALTDADEEGGFNEEVVSAGIDEEKAAELDEKLDSFFEFDDEPDEITVSEEEKTVVNEESAVDEQPNIEVQEGGSAPGESEVELDSFFDFSDEVIDDEDAGEEEKARAESWKDEILAADFDGTDGEEEALLEGEEDYDSFFDFDSDENEEELLSDGQGDITETA
ncbi:MAG: hypothetical protein D3909_16150, partial [Candidatus Electrothrix sp. ATG1]|nr:hypothetical protein [Candidatus Electrothrix sp. ATG1]